MQVEAEAGVDRIIRWQLVKNVGRAARIARSPVAHPDVAEVGRGLRAECGKTICGAKGKLIARR